MADFYLSKLAADIDTALSNKREPANHASSHNSDGTDTITKIDGGTP